MNTAVTWAGCPPGSGLNQLNDVDSVAPEMLPLVRFMLLVANVIPELPDCDHEVLAEIVYEVGLVGLRPSGSTHVPFATRLRLNSRGLSFKVSVPEAADSEHTAQGDEAPGRLHWLNNGTGRFVPRTVCNL